MNNVIDFIAYRIEHTTKQQKYPSGDDLSIAIQVLIQRLRDHNPINGI